jgi:hypothetical protein
MQASDKKRLKEEKDIVHRLRPFARLQTAEDFEAFATDILCASPEYFLTSDRASCIVASRRIYAPEANTGAAALSSDGAHHHR